MEFIDTLYFKYRRIDACAVELHKNTFCYGISKNEHIFKKGLELWRFPAK